MERTEIGGGERESEGGGFVALHTSVMAVSRAPTTTGRKQQQRQQAQISAMLDGGVESQWRIGRSMSSRTARDSSRTSLDTAAATAYSTTTEGLISGAWCGCVTRSGAMSPPPALSSRTCSRSKKEKSGEIKYSSTADNNISALVRNYNERSVTPGGSPFRPRLSPGKVSPLVEVVPPPQTSAAAVVASSMAPPPAVFSMSSYLSTEKLSNAAVSSSPPVEKIKASPTLFEMMSHEQQELQQESKPPLQTISLSQQLTFQEKMKTILAGTYCETKPPTTLPPSAGSLNLSKKSSSPHSGLFCFSPACETANNTSAMQLESVAFP